jgi:hypothetical protein
VTAQFENGTAANVTTTVINVETMTQNGTTEGGFFFLLAGNLQAGDTLPISTSILSYKINRTETRTYLGASRSVNVVNLTNSLGGLGYYQVLEIFDQASGVLLETNMTSTSTAFPTSNYQLSFSVIDTNIFAASAIDWLQNNIIYVIIAIVIIIIVIAAAIALTRKKPPTTETPPPTTPPPPT